MRKHPRALGYLFVSEMFARFSFYLLVGIMILYLIAPSEKGGLEFNPEPASMIVAAFLSLAMFTPFLGGLIGDRLLGCMRSILLGGILMAIGYLLLSFFEGEPFFYTALFLIIIGNGLFRPNLFSLLGDTYNRPQYNTFKDSGFNILYMGINIGSFVSNFVAAYLRNNFGWRYAFAGASIAMAVSIIIFLFGLTHYRNADRIKSYKSEDNSIKPFLTVVLPTIICAVVGWYIPGHISKYDITDALIFASIPVIIFYGSLYFRSSAEEKRPIAALLSLFALLTIFWAVYHQNRTTLNLWAECYTDRSIPAAIQKPISLMKISEPISRDIDSSNCYFKNLTKDEQPEFHEKINLIPSEIFQSINPFLVVILSPVIIAFWGFLKKRKKEPATPKKIEWGLLISAVSALIMVGAVFAGNNGTQIEKVSPWWLIGCYGMITISELLISPMGISLISKISPIRITGLYICRPHFEYYPSILL